MIVKFNADFPSIKFRLRLSLLAILFWGKVSRVTPFRAPIPNFYEVDK